MAHTNSPMMIMKTGNSIFISICLICEIGCGCRFSRLFFVFPFALLLHSRSSRQSENDHLPVAVAAAAAVTNRYRCRLPCALHKPIKENCQKTKRTIFFLRGFLRTVGWLSAAVGNLCESRWMFDAVMWLKSAHANMVVRSNSWQRLLWQIVYDNGGRSWRTAGRSIAYEYVCVTQPSGANGLMMLHQNTKQQQCHVWNTSLKSKRKEKNRNHILWLRVLLDGRSTFSSADISTYIQYDVCMWGREIESERPSAQQTANEKRNGERERVVTGQHQRREGKRKRVRDSDWNNMFE